jgi:hypothetical protein
MKFQQFVFGLMCIALLFSFGCGSSNEAILPSGPMTPEEIAAMQAQDKSIDDEESQGKLPVSKSKTKK